MAPRLAGHRCIVIVSPHVNLISVSSLRVVSQSAARSDLSPSLFLAPPASICRLLPQAGVSVLVCYLGHVKLSRLLSQAARLSVVHGQPHGDRGVQGGLLCAGSSCLYTLLPAQEPSFTYTFPSIPEQQLRKKGAKSSRRWEKRGCRVRGVAYGSAGGAVWLNWAWGWRGAAVSLPQTSWEHRWTHVAERAGTGRQRECRGAVDLGSWLGTHLPSRLALLLPVLPSRAGCAAACLAPSWQLPRTATLPRLPARLS